MLPRGLIAAAGFATLSVVTAVCAIQGWRAAAKQRFSQHRFWINRTSLVYFISAGRQGNTVIVTYRSIVAAKPRHFLMSLSGAILHTY